MDSDFISIRNARLRRALKSDLAELQGAREHGLHKASVVLAGAIVEAVLADFLEVVGYEDPPKSMQPADMMLDKLIDACKKADALTPQTVAQCHVLKQYRNLVHPGRVARYEEMADEDEARLAETLVEHVVADVERRALKRPEWAAEALYRAAVTEETLEWQPLNVPHKVPGLEASEAQRLLLEVIPERLSEPVRLRHCETLQVRVAMIASLVDLVLPQVPTTTRADFARRLQAKIDELDELHVDHDTGDYNMWITAFFRPCLMTSMVQHERDGLLSYVFEEVQWSRQVQWGVPNLEGIGAYLSPSSAGGLVAALTERIGVDDSSPSWERTLLDEMPLLPVESVAAARKAMDEAVERNAEWPQVAARLSDLRYEIWPLQDEEIPR